MKIIAYVLGMLLSSAVSALLTLPIARLIAWFQNWFHQERIGFTQGIFLGGLESLIVVLFSNWVFSWFGFTLPIFFIMIITILLTLNNINRYVTRPNKKKEGGYIIGQLVGVPLVYWQLFQGSEGFFIFW